MRNPVAAYGLSLVAVVAAVGGRLLLDPLLGDRYPFLTLFLSVVFAAWVGGRGPALLSLLVGALAAACFLLHPRYSFAILQIEYSVGLALYSVVGFASIAMFELLRNARGRVEAKQRQLEQEVEARRAAEQVLAEREELLRITLASDSSDRRRAEELVRDWAAELREAQRVAHVGSWYWDARTDASRGSDELYRIYGLDPAKQSFPAFREQDGWLYPHESWQRINQAVQRTLETGIGYELDVQAFRGDDPIWITTRSEVVRDADGIIVGLRGTVQDITERKQAGEALRVSEERLSLALNAARLGFWDWDVRTGEVLWNTHHEAIFGYTPGQPKRTYRDFADRILPEDLPEIEAGFRRAMQERKEYRFEHRVVWPDGTIRWVEAFGRFHYDADGQPSRSVGVLLDVTSRKTAEAALQEADRRKDEFLATLAHELRNPLAPLRNAVQILRLSPDREAREQARTMMERQLEQMVRLVDDLLDVSRISRGKLELRKERVMLAAVVGSAVETSRPLIDHMGHELAVRLPDQPILVEADPMRLSQVFMNLLNNAAKYTERGGRITLTVERQGSDVVVSVRDTGIGIAADQLPRLFQMFTQVGGSLERSQGGLGIGLSLVKRLVEMHAGRIEARSDGPGRGSEFVVRLPVVVEASGPPSPAVKDTAAAPKSSLRILVVDDNRDGADSVAMMLKIMGNDTRTAYDGQEGVQVAEEFQPEVILLDIGLPKLNGYEACRRIRRQPGGKKAILIAVTGWGQEEDRQRSHEAGFDHHMVKPVDPNALMTLLAGLSEAARK